MLRVNQLFWASLETSSSTDSRGFPSRLTFPKKIKRLPLRVFPVGPGSPLAFG